MQSIQKKIFLIVVISISLFCIFFLFFISNKKSFLPVLVYHHIEETVTSDVSCTPQQFETHISALLRAGFVPLTLQEAFLFILGLKTDCKNPVLITFDDGYESLFSYALPVARKYNVPMTVFMITSRAGKKPQFARYLSEQQIAKMSESGSFDFGSHTNDLHTDLTRIYDAFDRKTNNPVIELLKDDLAVSATRLKEITGKKPIAIAWPYGKYNQKTTEIAQGAGFKLHFTSNTGFNEVGSNLFELKRIAVSARDSERKILIKLGKIWEGLTSY